MDRPLSYALANNPPPNDTEIRELQDEKEDQDPAGFTNE